MQAIDIDGLFNVRASGGEAPWLIRSGAPESLTEAGARALGELGVSVIVDLREPSEIGPTRHDVAVCAVGIYGDDPPSVGRLESVYESLLRERGEALTRAVGAIADADGAALVHCAAGKDRTGLVVALARRAAGESTPDVVEDYALSGPEVRPLREHHARALAEAAPGPERAEILRLHLDSPAEAITHALAVVDELGGPEAYLLAHGLRPAQLRALRRKHEQSA